jgi:ABC-type polysaccharide/polyol phosphate transport system ATPase subunit
MSPVISLRGVSKRYRLHRTGELKARVLAQIHRKRRASHDDLWALRDVSFDVGRGEAVGLIGRNGSGKSTLLKLIAGIHRPTDGRVLVAQGIQIGTLIELGIGFHMELSGRENVYLNAAIHGLSRAQIDAIYPAVVDYSGLADFMDVQIKHYSSGMQMRLAFAVAANLDPDVLLLDEIFAVGDEEFQKQCRRTIDEFLAAGKTILFVSHSSAAIRDICRRVCLLEHGRVVFDGPVDEGLAAYRRLMQTPPLPLGSEEATPAMLEDAQRRVAFLLSQGVGPAAQVLAVGNATLTPALAPHVAPDRLFACPASPLVDLLGVPPIDLAIADDAFAGMGPEAMGPLVVAVVRALAPGGRFFASFHPGRLELENLAAMARSGTNGTVEEVRGWRSPDGQRMVVFKNG